MKMILVVYSKAADYDVIATFKRCGISCYTKMEEAHGEGTETEPKLGTHIWPGENNVLFCAIKDEEVNLVTDLIKQLKKEHPRAGIRGFILPMEDVI